MTQAPNAGNGRAGPDEDAGPIVVLGAGVAGLAAALRLTQLLPGRPVHVFEASDRPGGLASGWRHEQFTADLGPHRVFTELPEIQALLPELVATEQMVTVKRTSQMYLEGKWIDYPIRATELARVLGLWRMLEYGISAVAAKAVGLIDPPPKSFDGIMRRAFGSGLSRLIVEPYAAKVWKTPAEELDAEVARVRVSAGNLTRLMRQVLGRPEPKGQESALREFRYVKGGVHGLVSALRAKAEAGGARIHLGLKATGLESDPATGHISAVRTVASPAAARDTAPLVTSSEPVLGLPGEPADSEATAARHAAAAVISTIPLPDLAALAAPHLPPDAHIKELAFGLPYLGLILVALIIKKPRATPNCWLYFPGEDLVFNRAYEPANFDPSMAAGEETLLVFEVTARWSDPLWKGDVADVVARVRADALKTGVIRAEEIRDAFAIKVPHTYPVYSRGYKKRLIDTVRALQALPNLLTTGRQGLYNHNNMDHSMLMGMRAAEAVARHPGHPAKDWLEAIREFDQFRIVD